MKRLLSVVLALAMVATLAACGGAPASSAAPSPAPESTPADSSAPANKEPVTLKIANYAILEKGYEEFWGKVKSDFEAKNPHITIEWVTAPYGEIVNQVINMAGGGDKVDLVFGELIWLPTFEDAGLAAPVEDILDKEFLDDFYPNVIDAFKIGGKAYGVPLYVSPAILYYNKDLFAQAGLDPNTPPKTYDEMMVMAEKLAQVKTADGNKVYPFGVPTASVPVVGASLTAFISNLGGEALTPDGKLSIDNDGFKQAFEMIKTLDDKGYNPQNAKPKDLRNLFALGQLAMYYDQSWGYNGIKSINPEAEKFAATAVPLSGGSGKGASTLQSHCFILVDNGPAQAEAVKEFVQYVVTPEVLNDYMNNITPAFPAKKSMDSVKVPLLDAALPSVTNTVSIPLFPTLGDFSLELCTLAQAVSVSDKSVDDAMASFRTAAAAILG